MNYALCRICIYACCKYFGQSIISWLFYRAANGIFAKVGRLASEEVMVQLLKQKCLPILLYALDVCNVDKRTVQSLDFTMNRFLNEIV